MRVKFSVAPMVAVTDRHCRMFLRLLSARAKLYTEMIVCGAILHGERDRFLAFDRRERPLAIQLAGASPSELAVCAKLAQAAGYDEVNLNVGCPSARVKSGRFGACLMAEPKLVAECVAAMTEEVGDDDDAIPVTVKTRTGIDEHDSYDYLARFIDTVAAAGCRTFIIHARKAWLSGLNPKQNRQVPALQYERVYRLKRDFPGLRFVINGGINSVREAGAHLQHVDGVMMGRAVYHDPWLLRGVDEKIFNEPKPSPPKTRAEIVAAYLPYIAQQLSRGVHLRHMTRHMLGLFHGQPGARAWRRHLSEHGAKPGAGIAVVHAALELVAETQTEPATNIVADECDLALTG